MEAKKTGELIAEARRAKGLTQAQLAQQLHVSHTTISKWERGQGFPDVSLLEPLGTALELSLTELFRGEAGAPAPETEDVAARAVQAADEEMRRSRRQMRIGLIVVSLILLSAVLWIVGDAFWQNYVAPFDLDIRGAYQNTLIPAGDYGSRWDGRHCIQIGAQNWKGDQTFQLLFGGNLADFGTWTKQKANLYLLEGKYGTYTVEFHRDGSFYLELPGKGTYITMEKIFDQPVLAHDHNISEQDAALRRELFGQ